MVIHSLTRVVRSSALLLAVSFCLWAAGCNKGQEAPTGASTKLGAQAATSPKACAEYAQKVCSEFGTDAPICNATLTAVEVMPDQACAAAMTHVGYTEAQFKRVREQCQEFTQKVCAEFGEGSKTCTEGRKHVAGITADRCGPMMDSFDQIVEGLREQVKAEQPLPEHMVSKIAEGDAISFGPKDAKVTVVEFSDFECPFCARSAPVTRQIKEKYGDRVRFVFRNFPLPFHANAQKAAEAALAAHEQNRFWELHDLMFTNQSQLDQRSLEGFAAKIGLDVARFKKALESGEHASRVTADVKLGDEAGVNGTPTLFVNGKRVANAGDFEAVASAIEGALKQSS